MTRIDTQSDDPTVDLESVPDSEVGATRDRLRQRAAIAHPYERQALVLLDRAGWDVGELAMTFQVSEATVRRVLDAEGERADE